MRITFTRVGVLAVAGVFGASVDAAPGPQPCPRAAVTVSSCSGVAIQQAIDSLPPSGGRVTIPSGVYNCTQPVVIQKDDVELRGAGPSTILRLANGANAPVLVVGDDAPVPVTHRRIVVSDLTIDGNDANQSCECWGCVTCGGTEIRNNGITLRAVEDVFVERVIVHDAESGGVVTEKGCRRLIVRDVNSYGNTLDGLAGYVTEDSIFQNLLLHDNAAAGISLDGDFYRNIISDAVIANHVSCGIYLRDAAENTFRGILVRDTGWHGIFLGSNGPRSATANSFHDLTILHPAGANQGIHISDAACIDNVLAGSFIRASGGCYFQGAPLLGAGDPVNVCRP